MVYVLKTLSISQLELRPPVMRIQAQNGLETRFRFSDISQPELSPSVLGLALITRISI
jgi:hypothetical protein